MRERMTAVIIPYYPNKYETQSVSEAVVTFSVVTYIMVSTWAGNAPVNGEFPTQRANNAGSVSVPWAHNGSIFLTYTLVRRFRLLGAVVIYTGSKSKVSIGIVVLRAIARARQSQYLTHSA